MIVDKAILVLKNVIRRWVLIGAVTVVLPSMSSCDIGRERIAAPRSDQPRQIVTAEEAVALAIRLFGTAEAEPEKISAELVTFEGGRVPFLNDQVAGRVMWKVTLQGVKLDLESAEPGFEDTLERTFDILIDPDDGKLVEISSRWPDGSRPIEPEAPSKYATAIMEESGGESFTAFPPSPPSISFVNALNVVLRDGFGSPIQARQIIADYVMRTHMGNGPEPVWSVTLRGIQCPWPVGPPDGGPPMVMNRIRNVVHAQTGNWLGATNRPATDLAPRLQQTPAGDIPDPPTVTLGLFSPQDGLSVPSGGIVEWEIMAFVSVDDNFGLSMIAVDFAQHPTNPEIDIPPGVRPQGMVDFDRPRGISNPAETLYGSAYGGTQVGAAGARNLAQIGGAQNTSGVVGNGIGLDIEVDVGIGQGGQVVASGAFLAPCTTGEYAFSIDVGLANVLTQASSAPWGFWPVRSAEVLWSEVQGGCGNCDEPNGGLGCSDPVCQDIVCLSVDPFCCSVGWDQLCANEALQHCECDELNSPFTFTVTGSLVCPLDIAGPGGGAPDNKIAINDLLALLAAWGPCPPGPCPADFIAPDGVGKEDLDLLLYYWGACPCTGGPAPTSLQYEMTCRGMDWPNDWNTFMGCITNGTADEQTNCTCWLNHYLEEGCDVPPGIEMGMMSGPGITPIPPCPGEDPFGIQPTPG